MSVEGREGWGVVIEGRAHRCNLKEGRGGEGWSPTHQNIGDGWRVVGEALNKAAASRADALDGSAPTGL